MVILSEVIAIGVYRTAQVAEIIGVHPNTVRLYEEWELIPKPLRKANGYRVFTDSHVETFQLARLAFSIEVLQNGLRKKIVDMIKAAAAGDFDAALSITEEYLLQLQNEQQNAKEAIAIVKKILSGHSGAVCGLRLKRNETAKLLRISVDTLRNWELNGLLAVKRQENRYRVYTDADIDRLKIIRSLRCANYSLDAILRMLSALSSNPNADVERALDTVKPDEEIVSACDILITSLKLAEQNGRKIRDMLLDMKRKY